MNDNGHDPASHSHHAAQSEVTERASPLDAMWADSFREINAVDPQTENWKIQTLPLARVKKIMKSEEFIAHELERESIPKESRTDHKPPAKFMIASDAPLLMSKACELLIRELSVRAWQHTERNRRRTLQRQDVHAAVGESEVFDFLVDIVPRVPAHTASRPPPEFPAALPMSIPGVHGVHQAHAFTQVPMAHQAGHDFDPMHGQFSYFNPLAIPAMEGSDVPHLGASGLTFSAQQQVPAQHAQQPASSVPQGHEQPQYSQQQEQQLDQQQEQAMPQWTDPPV